MYSRRRCSSSPARPLSELDAYFEELKSLGIEEYIAIYQEAYAPFLETLQ